ncbi:MAG TPA: hypothetical protein VLE02_01730 [Nitrosarchaeum sp.]|nr:hypothetical protein [Nitrosarchaeum sp.]
MNSSEYVRLSRLPPENPEVSQIRDCVYKKGQYCKLQTYYTKFPRAIIQTYNKCGVFQDLTT